jgi:hypothetical protein
MVVNAQDELLVVQVRYPYHVFSSSRYRACFLFSAIKLYIRDVTVQNFATGNINETWCLRHEISRCEISSTALELTAFHVKIVPVFHFEKIQN